jgi:hypothetical protein
MGLLKSSWSPRKKDTFRMRVCHGLGAAFDDPNLVSCAGLAPLLQLAERAGLHDLVAQHVRIDEPGGGNARLKVPALIAGTITGADSIEDMALLRHGTFTFGHVRPLDGVASRLLINLSQTGSSILSVSISLSSGEGLGGR